MNGRGAVACNPTYPKSGHEMRRDVRPMTHVCKGHSETIDTLGWYCDECGEGIHTGTGTQASSRLLGRLKATEQGFLVED